MLKRYGFGQHTINHEGGAIGVPAIVEKSDGEYVLYEKYKILDQYNDDQVAENVRLQERVLELEMKYIGIQTTD